MAFPNRTGSNYWQMEYMEPADFLDDPSYLEKMFEEAMRNMAANTSGKFEFTLGDVSVSPRAGDYVHARSYIYGAILVASLLAGLILNISLAWAVGHRSWRACPHAGVRAATINVTIASITFLLFGMPLLLTENVFGFGWQLGHDICRIHRYLTYTSFYAMGSAAVLLLISTVATSLRPSFVSGNSARVIGIVACATWVVILLTNIPNYLGHGVSTQLPGVSFCYHKEMMKDRQVAQIWTTLQVIFNYFLPVSSMCVLAGLHLVKHNCKHAPSGILYLNAQDNTRGSTNNLTVLAFVATAIFALCWGPDKILALMLVYHPRRMDTTMLVISDLFMVLGYSYPLVNSAVLLAGFRDVISPKTGDVAYSRADDVRDDKMEVLDCNISSTV